MVYRGFGMEGNFTLSMEVGDPVIVEYSHTFERIGTVVKKWKNNVVVVEVEPDQVWPVFGHMTLSGVEMVKAFRDAETVTMTFNPDGRGRGDQNWGRSLRRPEPGETPSKIIEKNAGPNWERMQQTAIEQNKARIAANRRTEERDADHALALKTNAVNKSQIAEMATAVHPVKILNLIGRDGNQRTAFFTVTDRTESLSSDLTASVSLLARDGFARGRVSFTTQYIYGDTYDELIDAIILYFWGWT